MSSYDKLRTKSRNLAPAQRAAGGCSPLKAIPDREPAAGAFFKILIHLEVPKSKVNANPKSEREIHDFSVVTMCKLD